MPLLFLGDFLYDHDAEPPDLASLGRRFAESSQRVVLNLEGPLKGRQPAYERPVLLSQSESVTSALGELHTVAVNLANNHVMDWGTEGLARLLSALDGSGIAHFGGGLDLARALEPTTVIEAGARVGLLGFGWAVEGCVPAGPGRAGVAPLTERQVLDAVERSRPGVDHLVVCFHWGYEYERIPLPIHRRLAHAAVAAGADLIIGHHPHVLQAFEVHRGKSIYYSLGNFYFGTRREDFTTLNAVSREHSQIGLGVILTLAPGPEIRTMRFEYSGGETRVSDRPVDLVDLSSVPLGEYNRYYRLHRSGSWKPPLYTGSLNRPLNGAKLLLLEHRASLVGLLRRLHLHSTLKRLKASVKRVSWTRGGSLRPPRSGTR